MDSSEKPFYSKFVGNIPLLTNTNYHLWSPDIATHLQAIKALGIAKGTEISPSPDTSELYESYSLREAKARGAIKGACSDSVKGYLSGVTTASEMWTVLKERLNSADSAKGRQAIRRQFRQARPIAGRPISEYISKLVDIRSQLVGTDQAIDNSTFKEHLLGSLPESYNVLIEIINEREEEISVEDTIRKIQQAEISQQRRYSSTSYNTTGSSSQALNSSTRGRGGYRGRYRGGYKGGGFRSTNPYIPKSSITNANCYNCGKPGHMARNCPLSFTNLKTLECFDCGETGHSCATCPIQNKTPEMYAKGKEAWERFQNKKVSSNFTESTPEFTDESAGL
jgi:hypothetical protein